MTRFRLTALLLTGAALAGCVPRAPQPPAPVPAPPPVETPAPPPVTPPAPPPLPPGTSWADAPLTPGQWSYQATGGGSEARFGQNGAPAFVIRCDGAGRVSLARPGAPAASVGFRTSSRAFPPQPARGGDTAFAVAAGDPLLDALAFSRGRFAVEAAGQAPLIVPTWPELARVVEDCRR